MHSFDPGTHCVCILSYDMVYHLHIEVGVTIRRGDYNPTSCSHYTVEKCHLKVVTVLIYEKHVFLQKPQSHHLLSWRPNVDFTTTLFPIIDITSFGLSHPD
jgi:hypothetical protein